MYKKIVLGNGLTIVLADMPTMESISVGVWLAAGGRYERMEQAGISHFLEHMVFKGTKKRTAQQLKEAIEGRGGQLNGFTGEEYTCYLARVLSNQAGLAVDVLSDMVLGPKISATDFEKERFVILEEIKMYMDMPNAYVQELLVALLWPNHQLGMSLAGTFKTINAMNRKDLLEHKENFYNPENIVISVAGKLPSFNLIKAIEKIFHAQRPHKKQMFTPFEASQKEPVTNIFFKKTEQTHVALGLLGLSRFAKEKHALDLLHIILGGNMSSRLFQKVREDSGLAYEISSNVKHYYDTGALVVSAGIDNKKITRAIKLILRELKRMREKPVSKEELERAKEFYKGQLLMVFEDTMSHMLWIGEKFTYGDLEYKARDILKKVDAVGIDEIQRIARDIIKAGGLNLAIIGPTANKDRKEIKKRLYDL